MIEDTASFGASIALHGDRLAIGQPMWARPDGPEQTGRVGLYRWHASGVVHEAWLEVANAQRYARIGKAVVLGTDFVAAGAPGSALNRESALSSCSNSSDRRASEFGSRSVNQMRRGVLHGHATG